jgi:hypothetical protein
MSTFHPSRDNLHVHVHPFHLPNGPMQPSLPFPPTFTFSGVVLDCIWCVRCSPVLTDAINLMTPFSKSVRPRMTTLSLDLGRAPRVPKLKRTVPACKEILSARQPVPVVHVNTPTSNPTFTPLRSVQACYSSVPGQHFGKRRRKVMPSFLVDSRLHNV